MAFARIHDVFQRNCPEGSGFGVRYSHLYELSLALISSLNNSPKLSKNLDFMISNGVISDVKLSFSIPAARFNLDRMFLINLEIHAWLHPTGQPDKKLVALAATISNAEIDLTYDAAKDLLYLAPKEGATALRLAAPVWEHTADAALLDLGYRLPNGQPDVERFKNALFNEFYYAASSRLLGIVMKAIPLPQMHRNFRGMELIPPFQWAIDSGYLLIYTQTTKYSDTCCSKITLSKPEQGTVASEPDGGGDRSRYETHAPPLVAYAGGASILEVFMGHFMPAVEWENEGNFGLTGWSARMAIGLRALKITFAPSADGGVLKVAAALRGGGVVNGWLQGACGEEHSLAALSLIADGNADATVVTKFDLPTLSVGFDAKGFVSVPRKSFQIISPGLFGIFSLIFTELATFLVNFAIVKLQAEFGKRTRTSLLDLIFTKGEYRVFQRVADSSLLLGMNND